jgi:UDP-N-acetylglucosamine--N-acetylmuramyl-(pentapeptide) pyrophosphoryl-undecaprenol N-acetylglucosamine transferase
VESLFVASAGGHLEELWLVARQLSGVRREITWVTWDTPQSRALLGRERRIFIDPAAAHSPVATGRSLLAARAIVDPARYGEVVSTGALPAVSFMAVARARGIPCYFYESAARVAGPSLSGRLVAMLPGVHCYRQYPEWGARASTGFAYAGSVFDGFEAGPPTSRPLCRAVVTLGSSAFGFRRLVVAALQALPASCEVTWQTGSTDVSGLPVEPVPMMAPAEMEEAVAEADVVIAHAGVGSALLGFRHGHCPILVPRRASHHEHADDHQLSLARDLERRGLALSCDPEGLVRRMLHAAASRSTVALDPGVSGIRPEETVTVHTAMSPSAPVGVGIAAIPRSSLWRRHGVA